MSLLQRACKTLGGLGLVVALPSLVLGQSTNYYASQAGEYAPAGTLPGDQANPSLSLSPSGGFLVWQDNITDGNGLGISAIRLDSSFSPTLSSFRVNQQGTNDQENPQVALLTGGGAAFVWQGGPVSYQHIFARFLSASNLWITSDIQVNTATDYQVDPAIAALANGNVIVTWGSRGQDNADGFQGVYAQILSPTGQKVGTEFLVNQFTPHNQRTPSVAVFPNGNFIIAWVSEMETSSQAVDGSGNAGAGYNSVDIFGRVFNSAGVAQGNEFRINTGTNTCANPSVAVASDGSYIVAWSQKDSVNLNNSWDIWARQFSSAGIGAANAQVVNTQRYGDQYGPKVSSVGSDYLVVWTSMGQDGSREGVFGQFLQKDGSDAGGEQLMNTTVLNQQIFPAVASDGAGRFLVVWSSYVGVANGLDLYAQRYATTLQPLSPPGAPMVLPLDSYSISATWPFLAGFNVSYFELFVDGSTTPVTLTNNLWSSQNFNPGTTHTFQLAYVLADGRQSPSSAVASGTTWGRDANFDGLPDDWETLYFGSNPANWPKSPLTLVAPGVTVLQVFLWGANPDNPNTWLKQWISNTPQGYFLNWNTVPGAIYQVQTSTNLKNWTNLGSPRFEAGATDSLYLGWSAGNYYQIVRNRY
jgi:hypothetical protein